MYVVEMIGGDLEADSALGGRGEMLRVCVFDWLVGWCVSYFFPRRFVVNFMAEENQKASFGKEVRERKSRKAVL